jgi:DNA modification methylase
MSKKPTISFQYVDFDKLVFLENNPRTRTAKGLETMAADIKADPTFYENRPTLVNFTEGEYRVYAGDLRAHAAHDKLGWKQVPCNVESDVPQKVMERRAILDNTHREGWDSDLLANWDFEIEELEEMGVPDWVFGGDGDEGGVPNNALNSEAQEDDFEPPEIETVKTDIVLGDLFEIGAHRLLCGDSTKAEDVERLMGGEKADMVFTDPPYGMSFKGTTFGKDGIENDADDEWEQVLKGAFKNMVSFSKNAVFALCFSPSRLDRFFKCTEGIIFKRILTIYKPNRMGFPWQSWILTSEIIALFENGKPEYIKENYKHDVYTFDYSERPDREVNHPTVKPLSIVYDVISKTKGGSVLDLFLGSGTTMVAAHQLNRNCYGMEIDPKYCHVIILRMLKLDPTIEIKKNGQPYKSPNVADLA